MSVILSKAYFEITNACNAACSFCPGTRRPLRYVEEDAFQTILSRLEGRVEYLYFHLMGEPLCHPLVSRFAILAKDRGFRVMITSNGLLSREVGIPLIETGAIHKISLSLHSYEANGFGVSLDGYLGGCLALAECAAERETICALRLWNGEHGAVDESGVNAAILAALRERFGSDWTSNRTGYRIRPYVFLEYGDRFLWPGQAPASEEPLFCHALRSQIGILSDGTVVPCCLDGEGKMPLGNLLTEELDVILSSDRAKALYDGFTAHQAVEPLCRTCGYIRRFSCD